MLYIRVHNNYKHQIFDIGDLGWGAFIYQITCSFDHVVMWYHVTK